MGNNITKKTWDEFRNTGLFLFINSILHAFGWALVVVVDEETKEVQSCFPARTTFRGFSVEDVEESHKRIGQYLKDNSEELYNETQA